MTESLDPESPEAMVQADRLITEAMKNAAPDECTHLVEVTEPNGQKWAVAICVNEQATDAELTEAGCKAARIDPEAVTVSGVASSGEISLQDSDGRSVFIGIGL